MSPARGGGANHNHFKCLRFWIWGQKAKIENSSRKKTSAKCDGFLSLAAWQPQSQREYSKIDSGVAIKGGGRGPDLLGVKLIRKGKSFPA